MSDVVPLEAHAAVFAGAQNAPMRAAGVRAGPWIFLNGHEAVDVHAGIAAPVTGLKGLPLHGLPRHRREGDAVLAEFRKLLELNGSGLDCAVRLDQYYDTWRAVDPYHHARKAAFGSYIPPSTSVLMEEMLFPGCSMDVSLMAVSRESGLRPKRAEPEGVPVPEFSGFVPATVVGDYVFVAGQMANDQSMDGLDPRARKPATALWNGSDIRLQTEFLINSRLKPALEAGGSSLANAVKAQVYLSNILDLPDFLDVWNGHFAEAPCALSVVPTSGFGFTDGIIEINIFGVRDTGNVKKEVVDVALPRGMALGPAAVRAGDLLCLSGLVAATDDGPAVQPELVNELRFVGTAAYRQKEVILEAASRICAQVGTSLANTVRAQHFLTDLHDYPATQFAWSAATANAAVPGGAVRVPSFLPVPDCTVMLDMWAYAPEESR